MSESEDVKEDDQNSSEEVEQNNGEESTETEAKHNPMSKRQMKRMKKQEEKLKHRAEWRAKERQKKKARIKAKKEQGIDLGPSRKRLKVNNMKNSSCKIRVAVDCSFDHLMSDKQVHDLVHQLQFCYSYNRRAASPLQFYVTSVADKTLRRLEEVGNYKSWDVYLEAADYLKAFPLDEIVYLSSESDNVLHTLDPGQVYIIGGLVDQNHHKGLCHQLAVEKGVRHARLPIDEYINMQTRKVLTINHVFEILLRYTETLDWKEAFLKVIPQRKMVKAISQNEEASKITPAKSETSEPEADSSATLPSPRETDDVKKDSGHKDIGCAMDAGTDSAHGESNTTSSS